MTRKNKIMLGEWTSHTERRIMKVLEDNFGPPNPKTGRYMIELIVNDTIPESIHNEKYITRDDLYGRVIITMYDPNFDDILLDVTEMLMREVFDKSPTKIKMLTTARKHGLSIPEIFLDLVYLNTEFIVDGYELCKRSNIEIIEG